MTLDEYDLLKSDLERMHGLKEQYRVKLEAAEEDLTIEENKVSELAYALKKIRYSSRLTHGYVERVLKEVVSFDWEEAGR